MPGGSLGFVRVHFGFVSGGFGVSCRTYSRMSLANGRSAERSSSRQRGPRLAVIRKSRLGSLGRCRCSGVGLRPRRCTMQSDGQRWRVG